MPDKVVAIRYTGERRVDGLRYGLFPGYRYEVTREEEAGLLAQYGSDIIRLEPDPSVLPILTLDESGEPPKKRGRRKKEEGTDE